MTSSVRSNPLIFKGLLLTRIQAQLLNKVTVSSHRGFLCQYTNNFFVNQVMIAIYNLTGK
jgi:hypothetical protein